MHDSKKVECGYRFTIKEFCKFPGKVFIKFAHSDGEGLCQTMRHLLADGTEAHEGCSDHINHTEEIYKFVVEKLKAGCQVKVVLEGVRQLDMDACTVLCFALCLLPCSNTDYDSHIRPCRFDLSVCVTWSDPKKKVWKT
jgi:hypothetical protein